MRDISSITTLSLTIIGLIWLAVIFPWLWIIYVIIIIWGLASHYE